MSLGLQEQLLAELDREMGATRRVLSRVPDASFDWTPHPRSRSLGGLATHVAELPGWIAHIIEEPSFDLACVPAAPRMDPDRAAVLARFEHEAARARRAVCAAVDTRLLETWSLLRDGRVLLTAPRIVAVRTEGLYHLVHHRGQLGVYLRLLGVPLPPVYGPTADEGRF
ncbi:MAG TPA: DinB family protein [Vicinamibacterales bacterium]